MSVTCQKKCFFWCKFSLFPNFPSHSFSFTDLTQHLKSLVLHVQDHLYPDSWGGNISKHNPPNRYIFRTFPLEWNCYPVKIQHESVILQDCKPCVRRNSLQRCRSKMSPQVMFDLITQINYLIVSLTLSLKLGLYFSLSKENMGKNALLSNGKN